MYTSLTHFSFDPQDHQIADNESKIESIKLDLFLLRHVEKEKEIEKKSNTNIWLRLGRTYVCIRKEKKN